MNMGRSQFSSQLGMTTCVAGAVRAESTRHAARDTAVAGKNHAAFCHCLPR
jgi:hypothetical protein